MNCTGVDNVNHPKHYKECSIECIDAMRVVLGDEGIFNYCMGCAFKYIWRWKFKNGREDLDKARWYVRQSRKYIDYIDGTGTELDHWMEELLEKAEDDCRLLGDETG